MPDYSDGWCKMLKRSFPLLILVLFLLPLVPLSSGQGPLPGVTINCESDPELNVHPLFNEPADLVCTITNTSSLEETIEISNEFEGGAMCWSNVVECGVCLFKAQLNCCPSPSVPGRAYTNFELSEFHRL